MTQRYLSIKQNRLVVATGERVIRGDVVEGWSSWT